MNKLLTHATSSQPDISHIAFVDFSRRARTRSVHAGDASPETRTIRDEEEVRRDEVKRGEARSKRDTTTTSFLRDG